DHADERGVGAIQAHRIANQVELAPVLVRDDAAVALVPIQYELLVDPLSNDIAIHRDCARRGGPGNRDREERLGRRLPTRTRQAVERRVDRVALTLTAVV